MYLKTPQLTAIVFRIATVQCVVYLKTIQHLLSPTQHPPPWLGWLGQALAGGVMTLVEGRDGASGRGDGTSGRGDGASGREGWCYM